MINLTAKANGAGTASQPWLQDSVRTFFELMAWDGRPPQVASHEPTDDPSGESLMTMRVSTFFGTLPWEGQPVIAAPVAPIEMLSDAPAAAGDSLTLDLFSDLF
ncbi:hypothetical protein [Pseudanabaena sp. FACHB-2040]|uniref:hypothetical protein n=1 Tax=Pseudanabaena sp. FACHB-2040 TaxID=2692859 RepID=UPI001685604A|nr:hypothetical protein [Pseudanabaena sp. FACHB-2040]MBD2260508.1 hypothetical protein [Pseudanabaena sp. FACHB-2040]